MNKDYLKNFELNFYYELFNVIKQKKCPYSIRTFVKEQVIAFADSECNRVGIVLSGNVDIEHDLFDGKKVTIHALKPYDIFGEILIFSDESFYPYNIIAKNKCEILFITKEVLLKIFSEDVTLLEKYLYHTAKSYLTLNKYIKLKSQKTIAQKLAYYFIHYAKIEDHNNTCKIKTKTQLAEFIGVERQSLIRELNKLKELNCLSYDQKNVYIKDVLYFKRLVE